MGEDVSEVTTSERLMAATLRTILAPLGVHDLLMESREFSSVLGYLEWNMPCALGEVHAYWKRWESLDGFRVFRCSKTSELEIELLGAAILISDQALVPCHTQLQLAEQADEISWLACRIGEKGSDAGGMHRMECSSNWHTKLYVRVIDQLPEIDWAYVVTYGWRRV